MRFTTPATIPVQQPVTPAPRKELPSELWFVACDWQIYHRRRCIYFPTKEAAEAWVAERFQETGPGTFFKLIGIYRKTINETL